MPLDSQEMALLIEKTIPSEVKERVQQQQAPCRQGVTITKVAGGDLKIP